MKKNIVTIVLILVFIVGLSVLLYPMVSDYFNSLSQSRVVADYYKKVEDLAEHDIADMLNAARAYNQTLIGKNNRFELSFQEEEEYESLLNFTGDGVMGTLYIGAINVHLPVFHGTSEEVLAAGIGHLKGSSLPVGGLGTHTIISGHRGLPSSILLTNLDKMVVGDTFELHVLYEVLTYQVDQILVVLPEEIASLTIDPDMDYCTLVTCTPYGINTHRLLVRGHRILNADSQQESALHVSGDATSIDRVYEALIILAPIFIILVIRLIRKCRKIQGRREDR